MPFEIYKDVPLLHQEINTNVNCLIWRHRDFVVKFGRNDEFVID